MVMADMLCLLINVYNCSFNIFRIRFLFVTDRAL